MQDFLVGCYGTADELQDVIDNRDDFTLTAYSVGPPSVTRELRWNLRVPQPAG